MRNSEVASLLDRIADLLEIMGEERYRIIAYRRAASSIRKSEQDIEELWKSGRISEVKYVGESIAAKIDEFFRTGRISYLQELEEKIPASVFELMKVQGIGPRTAYKLAREYGIESIGMLKQEILSGRLNELFSENVRNELLSAIENLEVYGKRMLLPEAEAVVDLLKSFFNSKGVNVFFAGSYRRGKSTIGDIDIVSTDHSAIEALSQSELVKEVIEKGPKRASFRLFNGVQVDIRTFEKNELGSALLYFTGSKEHNIALREIAIKKEMKLNEYGLFDKSGKLIASMTESDVYSKLGLRYIEPELRENRGEIDASLNNKLPRLVNIGEIKGDLQVHSNWSDGENTIEQMALSAKELGYEYIALTDHSASASIANGLSRERFIEQWKEIERLNERLSPFRILRGVELEIRADGSLDYEESFLAEFDFVGASLHQSFRQSSEKLTQRIINAIRNKYVKVIFHPTNRIIGRREPFQVDLNRIIREARDNSKILEINGQPNRLDLDDEWAKKALDEGVLLTVNSDAHSTGELQNMRYGVVTARRAWAESKNIINTLSYHEIIKMIK